MTNTTAAASGRTLEGMAMRRRYKDRRAAGTTGVCRRCGLRAIVPQRAWTSAAGPKCLACGGLMDSEFAARKEAQADRDMLRLRDTDAGHAGQ